MRITSIILALILSGCASRSIELQWTNTETVPIMVEIWSSTDLSNWHLKDMVPAGQTNYFLMATNSQEFFKIRNVNPRTGVCSDWSN